MTLMQMFVERRYIKNMKIKFEIKYNTETNQP